MARDHAIHLPFIGEAATFGRRVARREGVEFLLAGRDGEIREKDSYGNDPRNVPG